MIKLVPLNLIAEFQKKREGGAGAREAADFARPRFFLCIWEHSMQVLHMLVTHDKSGRRGWLVVCVGGVNIYPQS